MIACSGLFYKPERAHFTAPPFKSNPLPLGFDLVLGVKLGGGINTVTIFHVGAKSALFRRLFFQEERHPLLLLFREGRTPAVCLLAGALMTALVAITADSVPFSGDGRL